MTNTEAPKGTDLRIHTAITLQDVAQRLNNRPRKTLGWRTPAEVFQTAVPPNTSQRCDDRSNPPSDPPGVTGSVFTRHRQRSHAGIWESLAYPPGPDTYPTTSGWGASVRRFAIGRTMLKYVGMSSRK